MQNHRISLLGVLAIPMSMLVIVSAAWQGENQSAVSAEHAEWPKPDTEIEDCTPTPPPASQDSRSQIGEGNRPSHEKEQERPVERREDEDMMEPPGEMADDVPDMSVSLGSEPPPKEAPQQEAGSGEDIPQPKQQELGSALNSSITDITEPTNNEDAPEPAEDTTPVEQETSSDQDAPPLVCGRCRSKKHTTEACLQASIERGAYGRWCIPDVGIDVAVYTTHGNAQEIVDKKDSAAFFRYGTQLVVADHKTHSFSALKKCAIGAEAYLELGDETEVYTCTQIFTGHNTGEKLTDDAGNDIRESNLGGITCYTCLDHWRNVVIVFFQPLPEPVAEEEPMPSPPEEPLRIIDEQTGAAAAIEEIGW